MFNFNTESITDSAKINESIFNSFYPNGEQVVKNTSFYDPQLGNGISKERTLTSRSLSDVLSGDVLFRSPKFVNTFYNKNVSSSLNSLLTGGSEAAFGTNDKFTITNPDDPSGKTTLKGGAALSKILQSGVTGKSGAAEFINRATSNMQAFDTASMTGAAPYLTGGGGDSGGGDGGSGGDRRTDLPGIDGGGIALVSRLTADEKKWTLSRLQSLKSLDIIHDYSALNGFYFNIDNKFSKEKIYTTNSHFPNVLQDTKVPMDLINLDTQMAYVSPAIIELCIFLKSKIGFKGGIGLGRTLIDKLTIYNNSYTIGDHTFGRAIDIDIVGPINGKGPFNLATCTLDDWATAFEALISAMQTLPTYLIPDLIMVHDGLAARFGLSKDYTVPSPFKEKYPFLKWTDVSPDAGHRDHIHLSFAQHRNGKYTGPGGQMVATGGGNPPPATVFNNAAPYTPIGNINYSKMTQSYLNNSSALTKEELFNFLRSTVMHDEHAAIMTGIAIRESHLRPGAINVNKNSGDISAGLFQINLAIAAAGLRDFFFPYPSPGIVKKGWQLAYKDWAKDNVSPTNFNDLMYSHGSDSDNGRSLFDSSMWIPINQIAMACVVMTGKGVSGTKIPNDAKTSYHFWAWGDYRGGPTHGFIHGVKYSDVESLYVSAGNTADKLKTWILDMFKGNGHNSPAAQYAESWINGAEY